MLPNLSGLQAKAFYLRNFQFAVAFDHRGCFNAGVSPHSPFGSMLIWIADCEPLLYRLVSTDEIGKNPNHPSRLRVFSHDPFAYGSVDHPNSVPQSAAIESRQMSSASLRRGLVWSGGAGIRYKSVAATLTAPHVFDTAVMPEGRSFGSDHRIQANRTVRHAASPLSVSRCLGRLKCWHATSAKAEFERLRIICAKAGGCQV